MRRLTDAVVYKKNTPSQSSDVAQGVDVVTK